MAVNTAVNCRPRVHLENTAPSTMSALIPVDARLSLHEPWLTKVNVDNERPF